MPEDFHLPDLGEGLSEAEIVTWHVTEGDHVVADQPLVTVETDKAMVEIPSPHSGRIARLVGKVGEHLEVGHLLVEFEQGEHQDSGTVVGDLQTEQPAGQDEATPVSRKSSSPNNNASIKVSPAVRLKAREQDIDLTSVTGSGPDGAILSGDLSETNRGDDSETGQLLRGMRRSMARRMTMAHTQVVPATVTDEVDIENWLEKDESPLSDVTLRLIRAIGKGCRATPVMNASFDGSRLITHERINLGIAVHTDQGLFVPVLTDIDHRSLEDLRQGLVRLKNDVKNRSIPPSELRGQTISLSNFGALAGRFAQMVVVPPQVAILGAGRIFSRLMMVKGGIMERRVLPLSLTFDHRVVTGGEAVGFLAAVMDDLKESG